MKSTHSAMLARGYHPTNAKRVFLGGIRVLSIE